MKDIIALVLDTILFLVLWLVLGWNWLLALIVSTLVVYGLWWVGSWVLWWFGVDTTKK